MKSIKFLGCMLLGLGLASCGGDNEKTEGTGDTKTVAQDTTKKEATAPDQPIDSAAAMKAWQDYMTPGEMHGLLGKFDGEWTTEVSMWMAPGAPASTSKGTTTNKMILGGRYQESAHKGEFDGMAFEGKSWLSFDNSSKKFKSVWLDNMGTGMMIMEGTYDEASKTFNFTGTTMDPSSGKECKVREVMKIVDDNTQSFEMYSSMFGEEFKTMEIKYTRKK